MIYLVSNFLVLIVSQLLKECIDTFLLKILGYYKVPSLLGYTCLLCLYYNNI